MVQLLNVVRDQHAGKGTAAASGANGDASNGADPTAHHAVPPRAGCVDRFGNAGQSSKAILDRRHWSTLQAGVCEQRLRAG
jgi:hypothetical protein